MGEPGVDGRDGGTTGAAKPLLRVLGGESVWPPPMWLMRQAGRYLPEYRALRVQSDFIGCCTTPDLATEITLQPVHRFGMDAAILFSDILMVPWALGQGLQFVSGEGPELPPIRDQAGFEALDRGRLSDAIQPILETVRRVRAALPPTAAMIGFAGSPFTVACYMIEGSGSRDFAATRTMAYAQPELFGRIMALLEEVTVDYLSAQIVAGAETVMLFDSWAGVLSPMQFRKHVVGPTRRIVEALNLRHPGTPIIGFPRLAGTLLRHYAERTGVDGVGLDTVTDPRRAAVEVPEHVALQGNLDPLALVAGGAALRDEALGVRDALRGRAHIFNLGHGILPHTPPDHVAELVATVRG